MGTRLPLQTDIGEKRVAENFVITKAYGAPEEIRTPDPQIRSLVLYCRGISEDFLTLSQQLLAPLRTRIAWAAVQEILHSRPRI